MGSFAINPSFDRDLFQSPELTGRVYDAGGRVLAAAERLATEAASSGDFAAHLSKRDHRARSGRPVSTVSADGEGSVSIEFGTKDTPRHRFLGRALESVRK
jgi:hypothetical protein